ncbi:MAG: hypothetical protein LBH49_02280 [Puniceicoccales bacterium]|jgi:riboflavin kinase/FMN adenylyltransferase|nr:hypothetical protein [Puniceicoccales bacterium]
MLFLKTVGKNTVSIHKNAPLVLAIGVFDGVHLGHQRVIQNAIGMASSIGGKSAVYTFLPHPTEILGNRKNLILTYEQKAMQLGKLNIDYMVEQHFDREFASLSPDDFMDMLKHKFKTINTICIGQNFRFGSGRTGNANYLQSLSSKIGIEVIVIQSLMANGFRISSTRIRQELIQGNLATANSMLGYNYYCRCLFERKNQVADILISTFRVQNEQQIYPGIYSINILSTNEIYHGIADYYNDDKISRIDVYLIEYQVTFTSSIDVEFLSFIDEKNQLLTPHQRATQMKRSMKNTWKNQKN